MLLPVILSWWGCFSPSTMAFFHRQHCWLLFLNYFLGFLIVHECDHSLGSLLIYKLLCWAIILSPYTPPSEACFWTCTLQWRWSRRHLSPLLASGIPPIRIFPRSLYDGAALIAPEYGNILQASVMSQRWDPVVFLLGPLSIKAYMCCLPYVTNRVPSLRPIRDRGAITMSLCRFFGIPEACREV